MERSNNLDDKDLNLIALLRSNARTPVVNLAKHLGVSRATIQNRINKLEDEGIILGYTVKLRPDAESHPVRLLMSISVEAKSEAAVIKQLRGYPEVIAIHHSTGHWDVIADIRTQTLPSLNFIIGKIRLIKGISQTETNLLLDSQY
ncbi:MAG: DNA-binding Lrp family transcriptional regulator [Gammaproteobacteria bacterium]|jgi:DNA-binding Lrp family transcriptional regulator